MNFRQMQEDLISRLVSQDLIHNITLVTSVEVQNNILLTTQESERYKVYYHIPYQISTVSYIKERNNLRSNIEGVGPFVATFGINNTYLQLCPSVAS